MALRYLNVLLELESRLEKLEVLMIENPDDSMLTELIQYKSDLKRMHRFATYHEQLFRRLKDRDFSGFTESERKHEVIDVWEQQERTQSLSQLYYETASDLIDGYISVASHRLNKIMKVLTVVMAIFVPLSFLAGIYGMNFENMPELHSKSGYFILLSIMASIATFLLIIFRRIKWL
jgi:magnesium transporter